MTSRTPTRPCRVRPARTFISFTIRRASFWAKSKGRLSWRPVSFQGQACDVAVWHETDMPIRSPHVRLLVGAQYGLLGGGDTRYRRCLQLGEQYFASARLGWKIFSQALQVTHGRRLRRFFGLGIPLRATASHSKEQVSNFGRRLLVAVTTGRPQFRHVIALPMVSLPSARKLHVSHT
jgi:hypothetical protein